MGIEVTNYISRYFEGKNIETQSGQLSTWLGWYKGYLHEFHDYQIYNGQNYINLRKKSLNIAKKSCEDWANLLMNENVGVVIKDQDKLDEILLYNDFRVQANNLVEQAFALSMGAFVESLENVLFNEETGEIVKTTDSKVKIDYVDATKIYPITFKNRKLVECAFVSENTNEVDISIHKINENGEYDVINLFIETTSGGATGNEKEFIFHTGSKEPLYQIIKPNVFNNKDINSPLGISIFANAIDSLKAIDNAYDSLDNEIQLGRRRIFVDERLINFDNSGNITKTFDANDMVYYRLPQREDGKGLLEETASQLRTNDISTTLQEQLNTYSALVGFGKNYYTFGASGGGRPIQTATGIIAQNSDMYRTMRKHELLLEKALKDMVMAIAYLSNEFTTTKIDIGDKIVVNFDDSVIEDTESEKNSDRTDVTNGVMSKVEYRMKWYGEDEEIAREKIKSFNLNDLDTRLNSLLSGLQAGAITPIDFAKEVYKGEEESRINEIATYIEEKLQQTSEPISFNDLVSGIDE